MTAIVGMMNRGAVALAADSAVTMGATHKVVNTANKIFALSKYEPVAIAIYSSASFMGTPWEIIIKMYRKQLRDNKFDYLEQYEDDFFEYLHKLDFFNSQEDRIMYFYNFIEEVYNVFIDFIKSKNNLNEEINLDRFNQNLNNAIEILENEKATCKDFEGYSYSDFFSEYGKVSELIEKDSTYNFINSSNACLFFKFVYYNIIREYIPLRSSGIVFAGYGEKDIFPKIAEYNVSFALGDRLKYHLKEEHYGDAGLVCPFAQSDVIHTIIGGMTPLFGDLIKKTIGNTVKDYNNKLAKLIYSKTGNNQISNIIKGIDLDPVINGLIKQLSEVMDGSYTRELLNTVSALDKTDLAQAAESLISLTCLVRRMQPHEETVGGPVDVLLISKGDGLIWLKRKHYFEPELNSHFFSNYFRK